MLSLLLGLGVRVLRRLLLGHFEGLGRGGGVLAVTVVYGVGGVIVHASRGRHDGDIAIWGAEV